MKITKRQLKRLVREESDRVHARNCEIQQGRL